jgi:diguanylate cyclase (GGDEF)-like protein/PAS domain S-box-containing protein
VSDVARDERLAFLSRHPRDVVWVVDADRRTTWVSPSVERSLGYTAAEFMSLSNEEAVHPEDLAELEAASAAVRTSPGAESRCEIRVQAASGEWRWVEVLASNLLDDPAVQGVLCVYRDVTDRHVAEERLRISEGRLQALLENCDDVVLLTHVDQRIAYASPSIERILGYSVEEFQQIGWRAIIHPDDVASADELAAGVRATPGVEVGGEGRVYHKGGSIRWLEVTAVNRLDDPDLAAVVVTLHDVTDRKNAEDALRKREALLAALARHATDVVAVLGPDRMYTYASDATRRILGHPPETFVGRTPYDFLPPENHADFDRLWEQLLARPGEAIEVEGRMRHADGSWRLVETAITNLLDDPDVEAVVVNSRDITERREAEQALRENEERFRTLVYGSGDVICVLSPDGVITFASPSSARVVGWTVEELIGMPAFELVHDDDTEFALEHFVDMVEGREREDALVIRVRHRQGDWRWMDVSASNMVANPEINGIAVTLRDVTDRVVAETAMRASQDRFRALVQHSSDVVQIMDGSGTITWISPGVQTMLGHHADDLVGQRADVLSHPEDAKRDHALFVELCGEPGASRRVESRVLHADGSVRWIDSVLVNRLDDPSVAGVVANYRDITARKAAERDTDRLTDIIEATSDLVAITDRAGQTLYMNAACRAFFGIAPEAQLDGFDFTRFAPEWVRRRYADETLPSLQNAGIWSGELAYWREGHEVPVSALFLTHRDEAGQPEFVSSVTRDISERKAFEARLAHEATHDPLTGLPNRTLFLDRLGVALSRAERTGRRVAVLFCDLDQFKVVNDSLGHGAGDQLLCLLADRLRSTIRPGDTVARFGGDEFVVLCDDLTEHDDATLIAERIGAAVRQPCRVGSTNETEVFVSISVGIALTCAQDGTPEPDALIRDADAALYRAKARGRNRSEVFDEHLRASAVDRLDIETSLRRALERKELFVAYQPNVDLATGRIVGVEALLRWAHPERGLLLPADFIGVAEETGLIVPIGAWVLHQACSQAVQWQAALGASEQLLVAVNLSGRQVDHPDIAYDIAGVMADTGCDPERVILEITESVVMRDPLATEKTLSDLKGLGVLLAVDDFGTGYSSLAYLRRFPVDLLKVDRAFVDGLGQDQSDTAIVAAVVSLAHTLGLRAIAEGVETAEQLAELRVLGCDMAQGYFMARALDAASVESLLRTDGSW